MRAPSRWSAGSESHGINTLGVCFLHSYANDAHERLMAEVIASEHPDAVVSLSSEVLREYREYERSMTTLVDAAVKPKVAAYVSGIARRLEALDRSRRIPFQIMRSNGGVLSADEVVNQPITTVLSGPAAGALGAAVIAARAGYGSVVTLDGGGTSTDVTVIQDSRPTLTTEGRIGAYPSKIPMIDVVTVGAGGGSIAWVSAEGSMKVGPRSAGADPGPLCYRKGGTEPTITDAHLVLGRIPPHLLGGEIPLDVDAADAGIDDLGAAAGAGPRAVCQRRAGDLGVEPGERPAPGHRQARAGRPRVPDGDLRRLGIPAGVPVDGHPWPAGGAGSSEPRDRLRLRFAHRGRPQRLRPDRGRPACRPRSGRPSA